MKRFRFSLQKLLDLREFREKQAELELGKAWNTLRWRASGVPFGQVAETIGRKLGLPIESRPPEHFGFLGQMVAADMPASSERTRIATGWLPKHPGLIADLGLDSYYRI